MKKCGIYFCLKNGVVVYIGQTTDLMNRMYYHSSQELDHNAVRFIACSKENLTYYETRWIERFRPVENHTHKGRKKYYYYRPKTLRSNSNAQRFNTNDFKMKFRIMTEKSIVGFGRFTDQTIGQLIIRTDKIIDVIHMYFGLSHISFHDDLLNKLKITSEWRIQKPGVNKEIGAEFLEKIYPELLANREHRMAVNLHKNAKRNINSAMNAQSAERLRMKNHGHFK